MNMSFIGTSLRQMNNDCMAQREFKNPLEKNQTPGRKAVEHRSNLFNFNGNFSNLYLRVTIYSVIGRKSIFNFFKNTKTACFKIR